MTWWLCDSPEAGKSFFPDGTFICGPAGELDSPPLRVVAGLFPAPHLIRRCSTPVPFAGRWDWVLAIVDHAERSQFEAITEAARRGAELPPRVACLALDGKRFRGQRQRLWTALRGNMHLTARFAADLDAARDQAALNMIPSIATAEAVAHLSSGRIEPRIKWVNDILAGDGKVSGVLTSASISMGRITGVTFGIGLNINAAPMIAETPFVPRAACLAGIDPDMHGRLPVFFEEVVRRLSGALEDLVAGRQDSIFQRYRSRAGFIGRQVRIWPEDTGEDWRSHAPLYTGTITELHEDLSLGIAGIAHPVRHGRMAFEENCRLLELGGD